MSRETWETQYDRRTMEQIGDRLQETQTYVERSKTSSLYAFRIGVNLGWCSEYATNLRDEKLREATLDFVYSCRHIAFKILL